MDKEKLIEIIKNIEIDNIKEQKQFASVLNLAFQELGIEINEKARKVIDHLVDGLGEHTIRTLNEVERQLLKKLNE